MLGYLAAEVVNKINPATSMTRRKLKLGTGAKPRLATTITSGFEALAFKASRGIEDIYE